MTIDGRITSVRIHNTVATNHRLKLVALVIEETACAPTHARVLVTLVIPAACIPVIVAVEAFPMGGETAIASRVAAA
jgi:hypothetical protein